MSIKSIYENRFNEKIIERWNSKAQLWDKDLQDSKHHLNLDNAYENFIAISEEIILKDLEFAKKHKLLDLACGTGIVAENLVKYFKAGIGIDISNKMINEALNKNIDNVIFKQLDCFEVTKLSEEFGTIVSRGIILSHYGKKLTKVLLKNLKSVLAKDGFVILDFLNKEAENNFEYRVHDKEYYTRQEIEEICKSLGYSKINIYGIQNNRVLVACLYK